MKTLLLIFSLFIGIQPSFAQQAEYEKPERKHAIYAELLGTSMPYSFGNAYSINRNYEIRIGAKYVSIDGILSFAYEDRVDSRNGWLNFPFIGTKLIGKKRHLLELIAGIRIDGVRFGFESSSGEQFDNEWKYFG